MAGKEIDVVADPQLRPGFRQEFLKLLTRSLRYARRFFAVWHGIELEILGIVIEIATEDDGPRFWKPHEKRLVAGCVTRRG